MSTPGSRRPGFALILGVLLGALIWAAWLGWDSTTSYDVVTGTMQTPYVTLQVLGCALTVGIVSAVLGARWHPGAAATGMTLGFWAVWTVHAASHDATGLYALGSVMVAAGLAGGTALTAALGAWIRTATEATRPHRAAGDASNEPGAGGS